ncbi:MAG: hypothetical protein K0S47_4337 [Herbinix sp.]|nr:hypothetical protein [Herbinix sp.]
MEPMDMIKQTGRTIIFEEFNKEKEDLCTLLTRDTDEISTEKFVQSLKSLEVTSYQQFLDKFAPTIYETVVQTDENTYKFVYELEKPKGDYTEISLKDHAFYKMIVNIFSQKSSSGTSNLEFNYDNLKKALTPMAEMEECKRIRKNLLSNVSEYMKLAASGEPSEEANRFAKNISSCRDEIIIKYQNKSPLGLLPLAIADKQSQIDTLTMVCKEGNSNSSAASYTAIPCKASFDDSGNIIMIATTLSEMEEEEDTLDHNSRIKEVIQDDFQQFAPPTIQNSYMSNLIVNVFAAGGSNSLTDITQLEKVKKQYQDIYKDSLESFVKAVSAIVEKFVGVKAFFDHAAYEGELAKDVSVIISNCRADAIVLNPLAKERFLKYFKNLSEEKDINKIWFGVLPAVDEGMIVNQSSEKIDPFAPRNKNVQTSSTGKIGNLISLNAVKEMIDLMQKVKIMTFFNFKAREETSFAALTAKRIQEDHTKLESVDSVE